MLARIVAFLEGIGLPTRPGPFGETAFLPGVLVADGGLVYDERLLVSPGDLLHEAGHLALLSPELRARSHGNLGADGGFEMGAQAWSWAALTHLGLAPTVVFHEQGYRGASTALVTAFADRRGPGIPILAWRGLTTVEDFPVMHRWLSVLPLPD